jgi:hypothetical protein
MAKKKFKVPVGKVMNPLKKILTALKVTGVVGFKTGFKDDQFTKNEITLMLELKTYGKDRPTKKR